MPTSYSVDFRRAVLGHDEKGFSCSHAARLFGTSRSFVINLIRRYRETGELMPRPRGGLHHSKLIVLQDEIFDWVKAEPILTLTQMAERLQAKHNVTAATSGLSGMLRGNGYMYKKIHVGGRGGTWQTPKEAS